MIKLNCEESPQHHAHGLLDYKPKGSVGHVFHLVTNSDFALHHDVIFVSRHCMTCAWY